MRRRWTARAANRNKMPGIVALLALGFSLAGDGSEAAEAPARASGPAVPRVEVDTAEVDLGTIPWGETGEALFRLRNAGERELRILDVKPG